jgi:nucleoside-diphosphate-sugar epimerase
VAVLGASGFLGNRIVEVLHLSEGWPVRPLVRRASGLALSARFGLNGRIADAGDERALVQALDGCDVLIHAVAAESRAIPRIVEPAYRAAEMAGCRRLVYLSSAMVHGQSPVAGTDETASLPGDQRLPYNLAKREAERRLFRLASRGAVEVVALRPGIVWGPRSKWVGGLADTLLQGRAGLVDGGAGAATRSMRTTSSRRYV